MRLKIVFPIFLAKKLYGHILKVELFIEEKYSHEGILIWKNGHFGTILSLENGHKMVESYFLPVSLILRQMLLHYQKTRSIEWKMKKIEGNKA